MSNEKMRVLLICSLLTVIPGGGGESRTRMGLRPPLFESGTLPFGTPLRPSALGGGKSEIAILKSETKCKTGE